ncbi:sulfotransferase 1C2-like [Asterias rubens]|uniref:sulfotransferase 1C2-like n=1 Tax=Asterias rubens TaxID=7604 RepID=UPI00145528A1|nr:sulfotransferase 1C2-like [Asterias rubens]XP_033631082.1 sulfotransferase 1C2-like [Asterias rubens]
MEKYVTFEEYTELFAMFGPSMSEVTADAIQAGRFEGIPLPPGSNNVAEDFKTYEVRDDDVWIVTYPKAGTTWTQEIASAVMHDGDLEALRKRHTAFRVLHMDLSLPPPIRKLKNVPETHRVAEEIPSPRVLKCHFPGQLLPPQIWEKKPKIIYVMRNPKDLIVSYFYFMKMVLPLPAILNQTFAEFFEEVLNDQVGFGPWWDHFLYFWKKRHDENILLLRFEDMKRDLRGNVEKISKFLGKDFSNETLDAITDHCTFANMKKNPMTQLDSLFAKLNLPDSMSFMRKGKVGDWKAHFTVAQNEVMDALIRDKLAGTGLTFDYE